MKSNTATLKWKLLSRRALDPSLVAYYYRQFGSVKKVLDLGCGLGCLGRLKPNASIEVYGLDIDEIAVAKAKEFEYARVLDLETSVLPFDEEYFDAILAKDVLEHVQKPWILLAEVYRVLRRDGVVIASVPMAKPKVVWNDYTHVRGFTRHALQGMLEDSSFEIVHIKKMGKVPLAGRLHLVRWIPLLLSIPLLEFAFGTSWEVKARKRG